MARTRSEIKTLIRLHTGRTEEALENAGCDSALKLAISMHPFQDAISQPSDFTITEDATSVDVSASSPIHIVTARIVEADGSRNAHLKMKNKHWWDRRILNPEDNSKGWPQYGLHFPKRTTVVLDRPANSGLELRLRIATNQVFTDDDTECPVDCLDLFVEQFATAYIFLSKKMNNQYYQWITFALGKLWLDRGIVGGTLGYAIETDSQEIAEESSFERGSQPRGFTGLGVLNQISGHSRYGEVDSWF